MDPNDRQKPGRRPDRRVATTRPTRAGRLAAALVLMAVAWPAGCALQEKRASKSVDTDLTRQAEAELTVKVREFVEYMQATVDRATMEIERQSSKREHRRAAALWRTNLIDTARSYAGQTSPVDAVIDLWSLCQRQYDYLATGIGKDNFGPHQPIAVAAAKEMLDEIEAAMRDGLSKEEYETGKAQVIAYARENPITGDFTGRPPERLSDDDEAKVLGSGIIGLTLAPLTALRGVGEAPDSVRDVSRSVDRFTDIVDDFPANARWQLQLLALNMEELHTVKDASASFNKLADSSEKVAESSNQIVRIVDEMPAKVRAEAETLLDRLDELHPEVRASLAEAQKTVEVIRVANDEIRGTMTQAEQTITGVTEAAGALEQAANAVTVTMEEIQKLIPKREEKTTEGAVDQASGAAAGGEPGTPKKDTSFSFQAITESANALGETTVTLQSLLTDVRELIDSQSISQETDAVALAAGGVVDRAAKRIAQLLLLLFVLLVVYGVIRGKLLRSRRPQTGA
jgi:hypothetical protein